MKINNRVILATSLALSLVGCHALAPSQMAAPNLGAPSSAAQAMGNISLTVKWPELSRKAQAMPGRTMAVVLTLKQNGVQVGDPKVLKRATSAFTDGTYGGKSSKLDWNILSGTGYVIEAKAYEQDTDLLPPSPSPSPSPTVAPTASPSPDATASPTPTPSPATYRVLTIGDWVAPTPIAVGTSAQFEVKSGTTTSVGLSMSVANAPTLLTPAVAAAARGATVSITGANFGADKTLVKAVFSNQYNNEMQLEVLSVSPDGTAAVLKFPSNQMDGSGKLSLYVDGIKTNEVDFAMVNELQVDSSSLLSSTTDTYPSVTTYYMLANQAMTLPVQGTYWYNGQQTTVTNLPVTVTVKEGATLLPGAVGSNGAITLPTVGSTYTVTVALGELTKTFTMQAVSLNFSAPPTSTRKISKLNVSGQAYEQSYQLTVPGYLFTGGPAVYLRSSDYTWTYSNPGVVSAQANDYGGASSVKTLNFQATDTTGTTTVTATLKMDPTKTFSFNVMNVGVKGFNMYPSTLNLRAGATASIQAKVVLTDDVEVNPVDPNNWGPKFEWSTSNSSLATIAKKPNSNNWSNDGNGYAIVTAGSGLGAGTVNLVWTDNNRASASVPIEITDDGSLNLTIQ